MASSKLLLQIAVAALVACSVLGTFNFVSIGDWGCVPIGGYHEQDELIVAKSFQQAATDLDARFVLNTGDNFYYCGIHSKDDALWNSTFENVFSAESTMVPWYSCLGNHDYGYPGSATAQMEYVSPNHNRWVLPERYYYRRLEFPGEVNISLLVLDATPCQNDYVNDNPKYWDPCGSVIPGCPGCTFHENVIKQSCSAQLTWMNTILPTIPSDDWKIVMVHAPAGDINVVDLITPLQNTGFDLYINGHVHLLTHYTMDNAGTYITTGAGCMVRVPGTTSASSGSTSSTDGVTSKKLAEVPPLKWSPSSCPSSSTNGHSCQVVFEKVIAGYTTHKFNDDFTQLSTYFYDYDGNLLHTAVTTKGGSPTPSGGSSSSSGVAPTPSSGSSSSSGAAPTPSSGSSSSGYAPSSSSAGSSGSNTCCYYSEYECYVGQICCNAEGESYKESECKGDNGKTHDCKWKDSQCIVE